MQCIANLNIVKVAHAPHLVRSTLINCFSTRVLFHNLISRISIYTSRAISQCHVNMGYEHIDRVVAILHEYIVT